MSAWQLFNRIKPLSAPQLPPSDTFVTIVVGLALLLVETDVAQPVVRQVQTIIVIHLHARSGTPSFAGKGELHWTRKGGLDWTPIDAGRRRGGATGQSCLRRPLSACLRTRLHPPVYLCLHSVQELA